MTNLRYSSASGNLIHTARGNLSIGCTPVPYAGCIGQAAGSLSPTVILAFSGFGSGPSTFCGPLGTCAASCASWNTSYTMPYIANYTVSGVYGCCWGSGTLRYFPGCGSCAGGGIGLYLNIIWNPTGSPVSISQGATGCTSFYYTSSVTIPAASTAIVVTSGTAGGVPSYGYLFTQAGQLTVPTASLSIPQVQGPTVGVCSSTDPCLLSMA